MSFAKTAYLFDTKKFTYYCLIFIHIIAYKWFEHKKEKWTIHTNRMNVEPKERKEENVEHA